MLSDTAENAVKERSQSLNFFSPPQLQSSLDNFEKTLKSILNGMENLSKTSKCSLFLAEDRITLLIALILICSWDLSRYISHFQYQSPDLVENV